MTTVSRLTILLLVAISAPLGAQQVPATLTLDDALRIAHEHNPAYLRAVAQAQPSGANIRAAVGQLLPNLNADIGWGGNSNTRVTGEGDYGQPVRLENPLTYRSSSASQSIRTSLTLFDGFSSMNRIRAARASADASGAAVAVSANTVDAEVRRRFYNAIDAQRQTAVEEQLLEIQQRQLTATQRLFEVAARTELDVLGAQGNVANQEQALETARGSQRKRLLELKQELGLEEVIEFAVSGEFPEPFDPATLDADSLVALALRSNPSVAQAEADAAQMDYQATAARGGRWPTVSASASFSRNDSRSNYASFFNFNPQNRLWYFSLSATIPLFTRFQTSQQIAQAAATADAAHESLRERRLQVASQVRSALIDLQTAYRRLQLAQNAVALARRRLSMGQEQYQLGTIDFTQFQQIVQQSSQDERTFLSAQLNYATSLVGLQEQVGAPVR